MIRKNAVPDQNVNNFLKATKHDLGCCDGDKLDCQYTGSYTQSGTVSVLTVTEDGVDRALSLVLGANSTAAQAQAGVLATLKAAGYYDDDNRDWPGVVVTDAGSTLDIVITGDIIVKSLTHSGGTATFDADCTKANLCTFAATGFTAGAGSKLHINGTDQSIGDITPGTTTTSTVKTSVEAALAAEGITATATVTTTGSGGTQTYNISIAAISSANTLYLIGASAVIFRLEKSGCVQTYI